MPEEAPIQRQLLERPLDVLHPAPHLVQDLCDCGAPALMELHQDRGGRPLAAIDAGSKSAAAR
jgi:hypothetical protein